jgi:hypothetical protein
MPIIKEVSDRKLPTKHDPEHKASQEKGHVGIGITRSRTGKISRILQ